MDLNIYTIYDQAANAYMQPFFMQHDGLAIRTFADNVNSEDKSSIAQHPGQFTLFKIGVFNDSEAKIEPSDIKSLGNGLEYKNKNNAPLSSVRAQIEKMERSMSQMADYLELLYTDKED